jgi:hypothetical protein
MVATAEIINRCVETLHIGSRHTRERPGLHITQIDIALRTFKVIDIGGCFTIELGTFWRLRQQIGNLAAEGYDLT